MAAEEPVFECFWPRGAHRQTGSRLAPRLATLEGKRVAQLWDMVFSGDEVYRVLEKGLRAAYPTIEFVSWQEFGNTHGDNEREIVAGLPARMKELKVDAVLSAMAA